MAVAKDANPKENLFGLSESAAKTELEAKINTAALSVFIIYKSLPLLNSCLKFPMHDGPSLAGFLPSTSVSHRIYHLREQHPWCGPPVCVLPGY